MDWQTAKSEAPQEGYLDTHICTDGKCHSVFAMVFEINICLVSELFLMVSVFPLYVWRPLSNLWGKMVFWALQLYLLMHLPNWNSIRQPRFLKGSLMRIQIWSTVNQNLKQVQGRSWRSLAAPWTVQSHHYLLHAWMIWSRRNETAPNSIAFSGSYISRTWKFKRV